MIVSAATGEIGHHRDRDLLRIGRHALGRDAVIASKNDDRHARRARPLGLLKAGKLAGEMLQPAERTRRLGQLRLTRQRGFALRGGDALALLVDPLWEHVVLPGLWPISCHWLRLRM